MGTVTSITTSPRIDYPRPRAVAERPLYQVGDRVLVPMAGTLFVGTVLPRYGGVVSSAWLKDDSDDNSAHVVWAVKRFVRDTRDGIGMYFVQLDPTGFQRIGQKVFAFEWELQPAFAPDTQEVAQ